MRRFSRLQTTGTCGRKEGRWTMDGDWKEGGKKKKKSVPAEMVRKRYVNDESAGVAQRIGQVRRLRQKQ